MGPWSQARFRAPPLVEQITHGRFRAHLVARVDDREQHSPSPEETRDRTSLSPKTSRPGRVGRPNVP
jgi:hypothetical protein